MITEKEICMELMNLIEKSELRIDRTNKMVAMLAEVSKRISESYMQHIIHFASTEIRCSNKSTASRRCLPRNADATIRCGNTC